jgi:hypothetical protein
VTTDADSMALAQTAVTAVSLARGMCFGPCPVYRVTLSIDGHVTYDGEAFVDRLGEHIGSVDPNRVGRLATSILRLGFDRLQREYAAPHTCMSTSELVLWAGTRPSRVIDHGGAPAAFRKMAALVEAMVDEVDWVHPEDGANGHDLKIANHETAP